jgi:hypothetical protein
MSHSSIKTGAILFALGSFALAGPALAVSPVPLSDATPLVIPTMDDEDAAVEEDLRSEIFPPGPKEGEEAGKAATERGEGEKGSDVEEEELQRDGIVPE